MQAREKVEESLFPMSCGSGGSKSILAKAASVEPFGEMRDQKLHAVRAGDTFRSQNGKKTPQPRSAFRHSYDQKSACHCGAKQVSKSNWQKHHMFGALLEVGWPAVRRRPCGFVVFSHL